MAVAAEVTEVIVVVVARDLLRWAGPHRFIVWVVTATASGRDIATQAPPVPVPRVVQVFSHVRVILNLRTTSRNGWIAFRLPLVVNAFGCVSSTFSSWRLQNRTVFHVLSSAANHPFLRRLLRPHEMLHWVYQAGSGVPLHRYTAGMMFSLFLFSFWLTSSFAAKPLHSLPTDTVTFSLEGPLGPTIDRDVSDDA
jgi:hypothetical protein